MYSSFISAPLVDQSITYENMIVCELHGRYAYNTMELYPVDYWYQYNVDGFGRTDYNEWDLFWFHSNLSQWHEVPYW